MNSDESNQQMMSLSGTENRAVLLTAPGVAAIAVIRLIGPGVGKFLEQYFSRPAVMGRCVHGVLSDGLRVIDDPVVVLVSSTVADLNIHGGQWVAAATLNLARACGFDVVEKHVESASDAFVEMDSLLWKEVLVHLGSARTELAVRALLAQPGAWDDLKRRASAGLVSAKELAGICEDRGLHWMLALPKVAIIGPANVGKSTLANHLFGQDRSITANVPGTTRDWVGEIANVDGLAVMLIDTAGRRETEDAIETAAIAAGAAQVRNADLILIVLDQSVPITLNEQEMLSGWPDAIRIANKADQRAAWDASGVNAIKTVAIEGTGMDRLREAIRNYFGCNQDKVNHPYCWMLRQRDILARAMKDISALGEI